MSTSAARSEACATRTGTPRDGTGSRSSGLGERCPQGGWPSRAGRPGPPAYRYVLTSNTERKAALAPWLEATTLADVTAGSAASRRSASGDHPDGRVCLAATYLVTSPPSPKPETALGRRFHDHPAMTAVPRHRQEQPAIVANLARLAQSTRTV
jgi:hypothetical protein